MKSKSGTYSNKKKKEARKFIKGSKGKITTLTKSVQAHLLSATGTGKNKTWKEVRVDAIKPGTIIIPKSVNEIGDIRFIIAPKPGEIVDQRFIFESNGDDLLDRIIISEPKNPS